MEQQVGQNHIGKLLAIILVLIVVSIGGLGIVWYKYNSNIPESKNLIGDTKEPALTQDDLTVKSYDPSESDRLLDNEPFKQPKLYSPSSKDSSAVRDDKTRIATIKTFSHVLLLYKGINDNFPIAKEKIILGQNIADELCRDGSFKDECGGYAMTIGVVGDSIGTLYTYQSINGNDYKIEFELEEGFDEFKAGRHYATSLGIK